MSIVIIRNDDKMQEWKTAIQKQFPDTTVYTYDEPHVNEEIEMALVWKHPKGSLRMYPNLQLISSLGAGVDFILDDETIPENCAIVRVVDPLLASDMSAFVISLLSNKQQHLAAYAMQQTNGVWNAIPTKRLNEYRVGILGYGALGAHLATQLQQLGVPVCAWARTEKPEAPIPVYFSKGGWSNFLRQIDVVVCLLPLTPQTEGILNASLFKQLPKGAYLINVARGAHLVEQALLDALDSGQLSGASLDVFHTEPLPKEHPFWSHEKIQVTPHIASVSNPNAVVPQLIGNYRNLKNNKPLMNLVSTEKGY